MIINIFVENGLKFVYKTNIVLFLDKLNTMLKNNGLLFCWILLSSWLLAEGDFKNMRVVWIEKPQTEAMIIWDSDLPANGDYIELKKGKKGEPRKISSHFEQAYTNVDKKGNDIDDEKLYVRHIKCRDLSPSTTYSFIAHSGKSASREYHFMTAPADDRSYKVVFVGDSRTRIEIAEQISAQINELVKKDSEIIAVLHGGDYANSPELQYWRPWLKAYSMTTSKDGRLVPIIPVCGNHESIRRSQLYGEAYGYPGEIEKYYYSCELSPQVRIAILNTEISTLGDQQTFLRKTLKQYRDEKVMWQLAAYHRPAYAAVKKPSAAMTAWVPLFDEFDVDLVLESDGHCIKRTVPIKNNKKDSAGTVYLGEGGYGAPQRTPLKKWYLDSPGMASSGDHLMLLHFKKEEINYQTIGIEGDILDQYAFQPRKR